jgi:hypothetical protein
LEFLADTPEFQARYAETVIYRIFYTINRCVVCVGAGADAVGGICHSVACWRQAGAREQQQV